VWAEVGDGCRGHEGVGLCPPVVEWATAPAGPGVGRGCEEEGEKEEQHVCQVPSLHFQKGPNFGLPTKKKNQQPNIKLSSPLFFSQLELGGTRRCIQD